MFLMSSGLKKVCIGVAQHWISVDRVQPCVRQKLPNTSVQYDCA